MRDSVGQATMRNRKTCAWGRAAAFWAVLPGLARDGFVYTFAFARAKGMSYDQ